MSEETNVLEWPYPSPDQERYYTDFKALVLAQEAAVAATREDRNWFIYTEANFSFNSTTGLLSWDADIIGVHPTTGAVWTVPDGSISLLTGGFCWFEVTRFTSLQPVYTMVAGSALPANDEAVAFAFRVGTRVVFRNGGVLIAGETGAIFSQSSITGKFNGMPLYACEAAFAVGESVAIKPGVADSVVLSNASDPTTMPAIGVIAYKPTTTTCLVQTSGEIDTTAGDPAGTWYYVRENDGELSSSPPTDPGTVVQFMGVARSGTRIQLLIGAPSIIP